MIPLSSGSGIVLNMRELGIRIFELWGELGNILRGLLHTSSLVQPHSGVGRLWAQFLWLFWIEPTLVVDFDSCCLLCPVGVHEESWDLKAANPSTSLGPWFCKEHPLGVAEELLGGESAAAGIALGLDAAEFSSLAVSVLCEGSRASSKH